MLYKETLQSNRARTLKTPNAHGFCHHEPKFQYQNISHDLILENLTFGSRTKIGFLLKICSAKYFPLMNNVRHNAT